MRISRRVLLKMLAAGATPLFASCRSVARTRPTPPSGRITLGFIGVGTHGFGYNLKTFLGLDDAQVVAVCDVFADRRLAAKKAVDEKYGTGDCRAHEDFRDLLADREIDAVVISTPDHWHVPISMMALRAGKDVMCEKPTLTIAEGRALVKEVARRRAVYQVGLEDRSLVHYHTLAGLVRNGAIGELRTIRVGLPAGTLYPKESPAPVPEGLNYDLWLGPAPFHPYTPSRTGANQWRQIRDYSGGLLTDWGAHLVDTAQVANFAEAGGPVEVEGSGEVPKDAMTTMPVNFKLRYRYANGVEMLVESGGVSLKFVGTDGWVGNTGWRGGLEGSSEEVLRRKFPPESSKLWPMPPGEHRNFLDCVKSRTPTTYTAEAGQRLSTALHVGNIAMELGRKLTWDPQREAFVGDEAANRLRIRPARDDWRQA
jgi:myo-inositol 2-dehydrogenase / D-chiro-inositol 1-dehydrogenase